MVCKEKAQSALYALNGVLVLARAMAHEGTSPRDLAKVLDIAEYLVRLLAVPEDKSDMFREMLADLVAVHPDFQVALDRYDRDPPGTW